MVNQISFQSMKNEMVEIRNENRRIVEKLDITQRSIDGQNSIIISLSEELKTVKKEMCIFPKWRRRIYSILEKMMNKIDLIDDSSSNDNYSNSNTLINNENYFENILDNNTIKQNPIIKTEIQDEIEDDKSYYNNDINMTDSFNIRENVSKDKTINSICNEMTIKTELENEFERYNENLEDINESREKGPNNEETNLNELQWNLDTESNLNEGTSESLNPQTSNLNTKTNVDSEKRPFKCNLCLKAFEFFANLKTHLRVHTGERPYECMYCSKRFNQSSSLNVHLKLHTGENLFKCDICSKSFTQSSHLKDHLKTHSDYIVPITSKNVKRRQRTKTAKK